jgi:outer membrane protein insertion porin family
MTLAAGLVCLVLAQAAAPSSPPEDPQIREIVVRGAERFSAEQVQKIVRLKPGDRLRREPAAVAEALQARYRIAGYPAARVGGRFDPDTAVLTLEVDEGRIADVVVEGLSPAAGERARREVGLTPGEVLRERSIDEGLERLERSSAGAVRAGEPAFSVEPTPQGARVVLKMESPRFRWAVRPGGPGLAPVYNRVDGFAPWLGVGATVYDPVSFHNLGLYAAGAYGFSSREPRTMLGAYRPLGGGLTAGYEFHDFTDSDDVFRARGLDQPDTLVIAFGVTQDFYRRRGHEGYLFKRLSPRAQAGLTFRADRFESLPVTNDGHLFSSEAPRPNPAIDAGSMRSVIATLRWAAGGELFEGERSERVSRLLRNVYGTPFDTLQAWRVDATAEAAGLGGDFSFTRSIAHVRHYRALTPRQSIYLRALVGLSTGEVPRQRRFFLGGMGTLRGYDLKEFSGTRMALATAEWVYYPRSPLPRFILFYDGGVAWGDKGPDTSRWNDDVGVGTDWPAGGPYLRVDAALRLRNDVGRRVRFTGRIRLPF